MIAGWVPFAAAGELRYGGRLHALLVGSVYAGSGRARGLCTGGDGLPCSCPGTGWAELYYLDPVDVDSLAQRLRDAGLERAEAVLTHGGVELRAYTAVAGACRGRAEAGAPRGPVRVLAALPPLAEPPAAPMASYRAMLRGLEACRDGRLFCRGSGGEAAVADLVAPLEKLEEWARSLGGRLVEAIAVIEPLRVTGLVYAPAADTD